MDKLRIFDTTLRDGEQSPGCSMRIDEKIEIARQLEKLNVDVIEAGFAVSSQGDWDSVKAVAETVKNCAVCSLARANAADIDAAAAALSGAARSVIHIFLATSPLHMQYKLKMSPERVLEKIRESVRYARNLAAEVEFSAEDASRTERDFLKKVCETALLAGARTLNMPDTVGYRAPQEMYGLVRFLRENVAGIEHAVISAHNHNDLGMAVANSLAMVSAGARQVECAVNGIGERAGNCALEEVVMAVKTRAAYFGVETRIDTREIYRASSLLASVVGTRIPANKPVVGANAFAHESGIHQHGVLANPETYEIMSPADVGIPENKIVLGKHSGKHAFSEHLKDMGYHVSDGEIAALFVEFKALADKKKYVSDQDIAALLTGGGKARDLAFVLADFQIASQKGAARAEIALLTGGQTKRGASAGDGPIDAAFRAIDAIAGREFELESYDAQSVTGGNDAQGVTSVRLRSDGQTASGRGVSTDVVESAILAYLDAINKI
ncbi:MAG: 2-isopropylmalate synthase, partial [Clostridiales bacterium]|nr:2-isopropylmalate synthase [Clostridiales bacterium]